MLEQFLIRRANSSDAEGIIGAHLSSIKNVCSKDYTKVQIEAWARGRNEKPEFMRQAIQRDFVWVVESQLRILGFSQLAIMDDENAEVMGLYLMPKALGQGLGKELLHQILEVCRDRKLKSLSLLSTLTARKFYEGHGFVLQLPVTTILIQNVPVPCYAMELTF